MLRYADAITAEITLRKDYLPESIINTIYFGGGTPSVIAINGLDKILHKINENFSISKTAEITIEANPDDLSESYLNDLKNIGFNRLSIGIQTFNDNHLKLLNRRHTGFQAIKAVQNAQKSGFDNISIDLIYGIPGQMINDWETQIEQATALNVQHISAYGLTYEQGTRLYEQKNEGLITETDDEVMIEMYNLMLFRLKESNFIQYEISNFCKSAFQSKHNSSYWRLVPYLGLGPSAHSFDGISRQWNEASLYNYYQGIERGIIPFEKEILSQNDRYNDYIMISLRTSEGCNVLTIKNNFGYQYSEYFSEYIKPFINNGIIFFDGHHAKLSERGIQLANRVISTLMKTD